MHPAERGNLISMGQSIQIHDIRKLDDMVWRFEVDRSLTGTAHEIYRRPSGRPSEEVDRSSGAKTSDVLADRILGSGYVDAVHVFSNIVTVELSSCSPEEGRERSRHVEEILRNLFIHYRPGVMPTAV